MKFTKIPTNTAQTLVFNAGVLLSSFDPTSPSVTSTNILGATTGGITVNITPNFVDFGADVDNCPNNTKELKRITDFTATISGTQLTLSETSAAKLLASSTTTSSTHLIKPMTDSAYMDFSDIWFVADYSDKNGETNGGFVAIKLKDALSTGGFSLRTTKDGKGQFAFEYTAHYSISSPSVVPVEMYIIAGTSETSQGEG